MSKLSNKVVFVTGASSGIGEALAREASAQGALVVLCARREDRIKAIAQEWIEKKRGGWTPYYLLQIERGMKTDIYPRIGRLPIRAVTSADVLAILDRASKRGAETVALNLRQWCSAGFRYAVATLPLSREDIADLQKRLAVYGGHRTTIIAVRLLLLTFVRTTEVRHAEWADFHLEEAEWRIPAQRMKMRRMHIVPLARQTIEALRELKTVIQILQY